MKQYPENKEDKAKVIRISATEADFSNLKWREFFYQVNPKKYFSRIKSFKNVFLKKIYSTSVKN